MSALISVAVLSGSQFGFYLLGNWVLEDYITPKNSLEKPGPAIKTVFFLSVCTSLTLLELLGFEILNIFPKSLRWFYWQVCLIILMAVLILIVPFLQLRGLFFGRSKSSHFPKLLIFSFAFYLFCFYKIGSIFPIINQSFPISTFSIQNGISRIGIVGVTLLALISGYGSVVGPASHIFIKNVSSEHVASAERHYKHAQTALEEKKEQFQRVCEQKISERTDYSTINWFIKRVSTAVNLNTTDQESTMYIQLIFPFLSFFRLGRGNFES